VYLARNARRVHMMVRGSDLGARMSRYLVDRIQGLDNVTVHCNAVITGLEGNGHLSGVKVSVGSSDAVGFDTKALFLFCGADANTAWLRRCVELDSKGFVLTGTQLPRERRRPIAGVLPVAPLSCSRPACQASLPPAMCAADR
jgi:thioredoxin reductase (NADPH)